MSESIHWLLFGGLIILSIILGYGYLKNAIVTRNEAEYRDIMEYQTMLVAALVEQSPAIIPSISKIRYFPDKSGFFTVLNFQGKLLCHGDYDGNLDEKSLPFNFPVNEIVELAKNGGGYIRYNYKGFIYESFVYVYPDSSYIICSGIYNDLQHIQNRMSTWKRVDKTLLKLPGQPKRRRR